MIKSFLNLVVLAFVLVPLRGQSSTLGRAEWRLHEPEPTASGAAYAVDPDRRRLVRFGGNRSGPGDVFLTDETWEFDGRIWRLMHPRVSPPPMAGVGMAYDPVRKTVLLFGGQDKLTTKSVSYHNQTWEWDGQEWRQLKPKNSPSPRWGCDQGLVTDFKLNRIVLYGGYVPGGLFPLPLKETWVWNGTDWKYLNLSVQPQERYGPAVGFCAASGKVILHGGQARSNLQALGDTWELDGEVWKQLSFDLKNPDASPAFRGGLATSDPASNDMLFLGTVQEVWQGSSQTWVDIDDLWAFDGKAWKQRQKSTGLLAKSYRPGPFHELGGTLYLVSGLRWTLSYDGKGWTELVDWAGNAPDILIAFYLVHDVARHETFLIGSPDPWGYSKSPPIPDPLDVYLVRDNQIEKMRTKVQPPYGGAIVHHPGIGKTVYFDSGVYSNDRRAWLFDGTDWTKSIGSPTDPIPDSTVYHPGRNTIVTVEYYRTWEWDAQKGWALLAEHKDGPRGIGLVFDAGRKKLVGYGPKDSTAYGLRQFDTWEWDGKAWTMIQTKTRPGPAYDEYELAYMPELGGVVLALETSHPSPADPSVTTWLYDGKDWTKLGVKELPSAQNFWLNGMTYDSSRQRLLLLYGSPRMYGLVHELSTTTLAASQPIPRPGEALSFDTLLPQAANQPFILCLSQDRFPGIPLRQDPGIGTRVLPLAPDAVFLWSLSGPIVTVLDAQGRGSIPFLIPKDPGLTGLDLWAAGFTLTPSFGIGAITNAAPLQITN